MARRGVLVRDGGSLELLGRARTLLVDKTGTLTAGRPRAGERSPPRAGTGTRCCAWRPRWSSSPRTCWPPRWSGRPGERGLALTEPTEVTEEAGRGVSGRVDGRLVRVGQLAGELPEWADRARQRRAELDGCLRSSGSASTTARLGAILLEDPVRPDARRTVRRLREAGFSRLVMVTGDRPRVAEQVAQVVGVDDVLAQCTPQEKVDRVRAGVRPGGHGDGR